MESKKKNIHVNDDLHKELIFSLSDIQNKISALNACSTEDFIFLSQNLKQYYSKSELLSKNASYLFQQIAQDNNKDFLHKLQISLLTLQNNLEKFDKKNHQQAKKCLLISEIFDDIFIPVKNFYQNVIILSLLLKNIKLNLFYQSEEKETEETKEISSFLEELTTIQQKYSEFDDYTRNLNSKIISHITKFKYSINKNIDELNNSTEEISSSITMLTRNYKEALLQIPELSLRTENYLKSINNIIEKLQYQDIIQQKITHIQTSHKEIVTQLNQMGSNESTNTKRDEYFLKIKDIVSIQIAQLIYTNSEFQSAIENITGKFLSISKEMNSISEMCENFSKSKYKQDETLFQNIKTKLQYSAETITKTSESNDSFTEINQTLQKHMTEYLSHFSIIDDRYSIFKTKIELFLQKIQIKNNNDKQLSNIITQSIEINQLVDKNLSFIRNYTIQIDQYKLKLSKQILTEKDSLSHNFKRLADDILSIGSAINNSNNEVNLILKENSELAIDISTSLKTSIEKVKYYDFFEQTIQNIVQILNDIYLKLAKINPEQHIKLSSDLESLKENYTMESQRKIHDQIMKTNLSENKEGNDIEFFE